MAKKTVKYFKLGRNSHTFVDTTTHFQLSNKMIAAASAMQRGSRSFIRALSNGHIMDASEQEYEDYLAANKVIIGSDTSIKELRAINAQLTKDVAAREEEVESKNEEITKLKAKLTELENAETAETVDFEGLTKKELSEYYEENYEVSPEDIVAFNKKNHPDMVSHLTKLENED